MLAMKPKESGQLMGTKSTYLPTVGSLVQILAIHHYGWYNASMLDEICHSAHHIQLERLELYDVYGDRVEKLARTLPHLTFLKSLHLGFSQCTPDTSCIVLQMLRENDHICSFSIQEQRSRDGEQCPTILDTFQVRLAQAYCQRNSNLAGLWCDGPVCLYHRMLQATKQVPNTKLLATYKCLMTMGESSDHILD
jgi:hypothetical protein